ncbi:MAG: thioredoxin family protein [Pseudomonadota bacterium]
MATPPVCNFDWPAPDFRLPATDGHIYSRDQIAGPRGLLVMFICNHCPYVLAVLDRIARDGRDLRDLGVGVAAICSNDAATYPEDSFANMGALAERAGFTFPYLHDESQTIARAYGAACTPDFFGFNADLGLQYRGRLDASRASAGPADLPRDLYQAMKQVAQTGRGPAEQVASIGCSIKWKAA